MCFVTLLTASLVIFLAAAATDSFSIPWWTVDGGGGTSGGGDYAISGTIGQPDAGPTMSGEDYSVVGGFLSKLIVPTTQNLVYLPFVTR